MAVITTKSTSGGTSWVHLAGTIQEVLDALTSENVSANNVPYWYDDGANARALFCRQE